MSDAKGDAVNVMTEEVELWKRVDGFPDYEISSQGRVKSYVRDKVDGKLMKPGTNRDGYEYVMMSQDRVSMYKTISRLVAIAFVPNPDNLAEANHIDEDKSNNWASNFNWMTRQQNIEYSKAKHYTFSYEGSMLSVFNLSKYCRENNLELSCMHSLVVGRRRQYSGYSCPDVEYIGQQVSVTKVYGGKLCRRHK